MLMRYLAAGMFSMSFLGAGAVSGQSTSTGSGQAYPNKPIRIVTSEAGGGTDFATRIVAHELANSLSQPAVVDNRPSGLTGEIVAKASPDGYTLLAAADSFWIGPLLQKTTYDPVKDFAPITQLVSTPDILVVHPSVPVRSVKELIALAKAKPGGLNYASGAAGSANQLAAELFKHMAGVDIVRIPYKGSGPAINSLIAGEVQIMFPNAAAVMPHVKSGRLRALAIGSAQRSALLPALPTVAESGVPGYEATTPTGMFAPAKTPAAIIHRLNQEVVRLLNQADVKVKFLDTGSEVVGDSPEEFAAKIRSDIVTLGRVIKDAGIRAD